MGLTRLVLKLTLTFYVCLKFIALNCKYHAKPHFLLNQLWVKGSAALLMENWSEGVAKYGDPYSELVLCIQPIHSAHTQQWTHTPWTHPRYSGQPFMLRRSGSSWGFGASLKGTSFVVMMWRERWTFMNNSCRPETRTRNLSITSPTL